MKIIIGVWFAGLKKEKKDPFALALILASSNMKMYIVQLPTSRNKAALQKKIVACLF